MEAKESKIVNKIITISGQPVAGKSTAVNELMKQLEEVGYKKENVHLLSVGGNQFRHYSNLIVDFIKSLDFPKEQEEIVNNSELQELMKNEKYRRAILNTVVYIRSPKVDISEFDIEDANNMPEFADMREILDEIVDKTTKKIGEKINSRKRPDEIFIVDSRLGFFNIPDSFAVRFTVNDLVGGKRNFEREKTFSSLESAIEDRKQRMKGEQERYLEKYGVDLEDENNYNLIIDTSYNSPQNIAKTIIECLDKEQKNEPYNKKWGVEEKEEER